MNRLVLITIVLMTALYVLPLYSQYDVISPEPQSDTGSAQNDYSEGFDVGTMAATSNYWWGASSCVTGCCVGGVMPVTMGWSIVAVTAAAGSIPLLVAAAGNPQPDYLMMHSVKDQSTDYQLGFKQGYTKSKKKKNIESATLGMGLAVFGAVAAILLIQSNDTTSDEYKTHP